MDGSVENAVQRPSGLRPPSRFNSAAAGLHEISDSQSNARATAKTLMAPPSQIAQTLKRPTTYEFPQPESKQRKTVIEQGGECYGGIPSVTAAPATRPVKPASFASIASQIRQPSANPVASKQVPLGVPRQPSKNNYAASLGPGARPPVAAGRSNNAAFAKSVSGASRTQGRPRPATAFGSYGDLDESRESPGQNAWDVDDRLKEFESEFKVIKEAMDMSLADKKTMDQMIEMANGRVQDLQKDRDVLLAKNSQLESDLGELRQQIQSLTLDLESERRSRKFDLDDREREHQHELESLKRAMRDELDRSQKAGREAVEEAERRNRLRLEEERDRIEREREEMRTQLGSKQQEAGLALREKDREIDELRSQLERLKGDVDREMTLKEALQKSAIEMQTANLSLEAQIHQFQGKVRFLESSNQQQADSYTEMESRLQEALVVAEEARQKLIKEETERRVLFNKYQELKGNIRVMCRVRPILDSSEGDEAGLAYPDTKTSAQIDIMTEERSATGTVSRRTMPFEFDRVFTPSVQNEEVFGEISQLVQSALDGYNVCIFCYGQTGSGKTFTMSSTDGMIPRATHMIYETTEQLREKSWSYNMEGSFVEVYNEELHDLLATTQMDRSRKLTIQHDDVRKQTTVIGCRSVRLDSPDKVETMLREAQGNRSVAATKANERSSRSHSVFILKLVGENAATGERCEGTLNLVDLAGSERLKHSQVEGNRMRETQNINKSLSCLGDVIEALGKKGGNTPGGGHVPYRNSKLTHLLQYSLGGNSKTLMFVMVSPLEAHLKETITSLRFATKVHNTHIGTAKSTKKLREHRESS